MTARQMGAGHLALPSMLGLLVGCSTLSTDPLSPPHLRRASTKVQETEAAAEQKLSPEYQEWLNEVRHFCADTGREFAMEYRKNDEWPSPYMELATHAVRQPLNLQAENGRLQMLSVWDYHFDVGSGKLNAMGHKRLQDIIDQADSLGHTVYVRRTLKAQETSARVAAVREELDKLTRGHASFEVVEASSIPSSVTGDEAQTTMKLLTAPSKPASSGSSSSSSSGYSGGSSGK